MPIKWSRTNRNLLSGSHYLGRQHWQELPLGGRAGFLLHLFVHGNKLTFSTSPLTRLVAVGLQMGNTVIPSYVVDCYPLQSMSIITFYSVFLDLSALINPVSSNIKLWKTSDSYTVAKLYLVFHLRLGFSIQLHNCFYYCRNYHNWPLYSSNCCGSCIRSKNKGKMWEPYLGQPRIWYALSLERRVGLADKYE